MKPLTTIIKCTVEENIYKRIAWMYMSYFITFVSVVISSYLLLPDGILISKHFPIGALELSSDLWASTFQIFGYNPLPMSLIIAASLIAQEFRMARGIFLSTGYTGCWTITFFCGVILGTWSFEIAIRLHPFVSD